MDSNAIIYGWQYRIIAVDEIHLERLFVPIEFIVWSKTNHNQWLEAFNVFNHIYWKVLHTLLICALCIKIRFYFAAIKFSHRIQFIGWHVVSLRSKMCAAQPALVISIHFAYIFSPLCPHTQHTNTKIKLIQILLAHCCCTYTVQRTTCD